LKREMNQMDLVLSMRMPDNLFKSKVLPLAACDKIRDIYVVTDHPSYIEEFTFPATEKVTYHFPPLIMQKCVGRVISRFLWLLYTASRTHAKVLMSYCLLFHGVNTRLVGFFLRKRTVHQLIGGPNELKVGYARDNAILRKAARLPYPIRRLVEKSLMRITGSFDLLVAKGSTSIKALEACNIQVPVVISPGGVDVDRFTNEGSDVVPKLYDLITVSKLNVRKNLSRLLETIALVKEYMPHIRALIIGSGPESMSLIKMAGDLDLADNVDFIGFQNNPEYFLRRSKVFILTSLSEGISTAMTEAMACGLPAVVSEVGDITDLAIEEVTAKVVQYPYRADEFAEAVVDLLHNERTRMSMGSNARRMVKKAFSIEAEAKRWSNTLTHLLTSTKSKFAFAS
jgi:glycosyltransferase involved in cell wall biosynthesis